MARHLRLEFAGAVYHLTSRGNPRQNIFFSDKTASCGGEHPLWPRAGLNPAREVVSFNEKALLANADANFAPGKGAFL